MPHGGLALANSLATAIEAVGLIYVMRRRLDGLQGRFILDGAWKALVAASIMGVVLLSWMRITADLPVWMVVLGGLLCGAGVFGLCALLFQIGELHNAIRLVRKRLVG